MITPRQASKSERGTVAGGFATPARSRGSAEPDGPASLDPATRHIAVHEESFWMLRATAEEPAGRSLCSR